MIKKTFVKSKSCYKVTFSLPKEAAANAKEVKVLGDFNNWEWESGLKMKPTKNEFTAVLELETGKDYQFRYMIDNNTWENDWNADDYIATGYGVDNSLVACPSVEGVKVNAPKAKKTTKTTAKKATATKKAVKSTTTKAATTKKAATATKTTAKKAIAKKAPVAKKTATKKATTSAAAKLDAKMNAKGLQVIEGVGPKIASLMNEAGLVTFADVAKASQATLKKVLENAGSRFKLANPSTWSEQAKLASQGKWEALEKLQGELKGGKR